MIEDLTLHLAGGIHTGHNGHIYLLPKARHRRHAGGMRLTHTVLYLFGIGVHNELGALRESQIGPSALKDMGERQKVYHPVFLANRHTLVVIFKRGMILSVG